LLPWSIATAMTTAMTTTKAVTICPSKLGTFQQHQAVVSAEDEGAEKGAVDPAPRRPSGATGPGRRI